MQLLARNIGFKKRKMRIGKRSMKVLIADTPRKMTVGLMFMEKLAIDECMLFEFPRDGQHPIWTRNMRFPIDIVWCDSDGRIVDFVLSAPPAGRFEFFGFRPMARSRYVLEFNSGFVKKNKMKKEEKIIFK